MSYTRNLTYTYIVHLQYVCLCNSMDLIKQHAHSPQHAPTRHLLFLFFLFVVMLMDLSFSCFFNFFNTFVLLFLFFFIFYFFVVAIFITILPETLFSQWFSVCGQYVHIFPSDKHNFITIQYLLSFHFISSNRNRNGFYLID